MFRRSFRLLLVTQTVALLLTTPWSWIVAFGVAGDHSRLNLLLAAAGVFLLHSGLAGLLIGLAGRAGSIGRRLFECAAWAWATGPWIVVQLWWIDPFAGMPRSERLASVGGLSLLCVIALTVIGMRLARRTPGPAWRVPTLVHDVFVLLVVLGGIGVWFVARGSNARDDAPPNVVLLVADALRHDMVGAHGGPPALTPNLDAWARTATVFDGAIANGPTSIPGHASLLSGQGVEEHGAFTNNHSLAAAPEGIAHRLRARGYRTVGVCANQLIGRRSGFADGFDLYWSTTQSRLAGAPVPLGVLDVPVVRFALEIADADVAALSIELVATRLPEPFFLFAQVLHTHVPYQDRAGWTTPARVDSLTALYEVGALANTTNYPDRELAHFHATYLGAVRSVDALFGDWRARLDARYGDGRVKWIVTADHGEILGEHGHDMVGEHEGPFNASLRIPLLADAGRAGATIPDLTGQDRVAALAEFIASGGDAVQLEAAVTVDTHFALTDSAYVLLDDSLKVVWSRPRPEWMPSFHRWRIDRFDRNPMPIEDSPRATALFDSLARLVQDSDIQARMRATETLDEDRLRALRALGYIE